MRHLPLRYIFPQLRLASSPLSGLEPGVNDNALARAIVMHGAPYASAASIKSLGRLGRSWGCPVVRPEAARGLIDTIKDGQLIFIYYPDEEWLKHSTFLNCTVH